MYTARRVSGTSQGSRECSQMRHQCIFPRYFAPVDGAFIGRGGCKNANARKNELAKTSEKTRYRWHNAHQCKAIQSSPNTTQAHRCPSYFVFYYFSCFSFLFLFLFLALTCSAHAASMLFSPNPSV